MNVIKNDGSSQPLDPLKIQKATAWACKDLPDVSQSELEVNVHAKFFDGMKTSAIQDALIISGGELISREAPGYRFATARLLLQKVYKEVTGGPVEYPSLRSYIETGVKEKQLDPRLLQFDLESLNAFIKPERDLQFDYLGLQTLADRYLIRRMAGPDEVGDIIELPQHFFMRVAMGLTLRDVVMAGAAANSLRITGDAEEAYDLLSSFDYMTSTPTLFNAGTTHPQLSSCYLNTVADQLYSEHDEEQGHHFASIYGTIEECARLSKYAGGIGTDWNRVRPSGSIIKGTNGKSAGIVPYIKVWNDTAIAVNQGGKRNGAFAAYVEPWHPDFPAFIELRKNSGEERRRAHEIFPAAWTPDLLMKRKDIPGAMWSFFAPDEFPELHDLFGAEFEKRYEELESEGKFRFQMPAIELWRKMMTMLFETGHPWITFKDECNRRNPQDHAGVIHNSNLCTEITLNTDDNETAVCNLGSINLVRHVTPEGKIDKAKIARTVRIATRLLDNVVDINFYPSIRAKNSNLQHRPVGLGVMGLTDMLSKMGVEWESQQSLDVQDALFESISYNAIETSSDLAAERGRYPSYEGSKWSRGIFPIDTANAEAMKLTAWDRGAGDYNWAELRNKVAIQGMRNSNLMAIAPTATIANIVNVTPSIESPFELEYTKTNLSGTFQVVSSALDYGFPVKAAFEVDQLFSIDAAAVRGKWIDQSQSLNLFVRADIKGSALSMLYTHAWKRGLKTTYYLRRLTVTTESIVASQEANATSALRQEELDALELAALREQRDFPADVAEEVKFCSINNPDCESCQ